MDSRIRVETGAFLELLESDLDVLATSRTWADVCLYTGVDVEGLGGRSVMKEVRAEEEACLRSRALSSMADLVRWTCAP